MRSFFAFCALASLTSCSSTQSDPLGAGSSLAMPSAGVQVASNVVATEAKNDADDAVAPEKFTEGAKAFASVRDDLLKEYYAAGFTEDDLYRAATQGMLERLDPKMKKWNKLLPPDELATLRSDLKGEFVGIGSQIRFDESTGYADVLAVMPGTPSAKVGILAGDKIVSINGQLYRGKKLRDVMADLRGKVGETVAVSILRADKLLPFSIRREMVSYDSVMPLVLADVGYLRVRSFSGKTVPMLRAALDDFATKNVRSLVVDLRDNQGGLFDEAVASADVLLPAGTPIVNIKRRDQKTETRSSKNEHVVLGQLPMAVLVDRETSSGAEFLTAALQEGRHAPVIGGRTLGKWSLQTVKDLSNGYSVKFTVGLFASPSGRSFDGMGMLPDVEVTMDEGQLRRALVITDPEPRFAADPQLRTAVAMLRGKN